MCMRRIVVVAAFAVVLVAVTMVVRAATSGDGLTSALGVWGFVLAAVGVVTGATGLWPSTRRSRTGGHGDVQVIHAHKGDAFGVQNGDQHVNRGPRDAGSGRERP